MRYIQSKRKQERSNPAASIGAEYAIKQPANYQLPVQPIGRPSISEQVYAQMGQRISCLDSQMNNPYSSDTYNFVYEVQTDEGIFALLYGDNVVKYIVRTTTNSERSNLKGGLAHTSKIKDKPIVVCDAIFFKCVNKYQREDKPGKQYYAVEFSCNSSSSDINESRVVESGDMKSSRFSLTFRPEIVKSGQEALCSTFLRTEIYRISNLSPERMIPSRPGWYNDEVYGWVFLERSRYNDLSDNDLPPAMCRRHIGKTARTVNEVFCELQPMIGQRLEKKLLWSIRLISPILMQLGKHGVAVRTIIAPIIETTDQIAASASILKTGDFDNYGTLSLQSSQAEIEKEICGARDGVASFIGPLTAVESKYNGKNVNYIRNAAIGANGADKTVRTIVSLIGRFIPANLPPEFIFTIDCKEMANDADVNKLRNVVLEFEAAYISYIENHFDVVESWISSVAERYKAEPAPGIEKNKEGLYIALNALQSMMKGCFGIELFSEDEFERVTNLFEESETEIVTPDYAVRDKFVTITIDMITENIFSFMEISSAHKSYSSDSRTLILDRRKGFLNFTMNALDMVADRIPTVKDGAELAGILKACNTLKCTDNCARQISTPQGRTGFYSVYLSELGDDILEIIDFLEMVEFFFDPAEVPPDFVPIVWYNGRCAGYVIDGKGLPNPHINISGLSGMGKNRGAYRTAEGQLRLKSKIIFLDIKGGANEESLREMKCNLDKYQIHDLKNEGFPFPIFDLSAFEGTNAKASFILNVIGAAVGLTAIQYNDVLVCIESILHEDSTSFSIDELLEKLPPNKSQTLKNKIQPLVSIIQAYTPKDGKYKYSSCRKFIKDTSKINILSINQDSLPALRSIVYTLLQTVFEHQVIDSSSHVVIYADEMQKYTSDSPFQKLYSEAREFNLSVIAMTQEYRATGNEIRKISSNAAMEIFYPPTNDSEKRVTTKLDKEYDADEHHRKGRGYIWTKGFFWNKAGNEHKFATLRGMNDDEKFSALESYPEGYCGTGY